MTTPCKYCGNPADVRVSGVLECAACWLMRGNHGRKGKQASSSGQSKIREQLRQNIQKGQAR
jgi:hypothetical protein